MIFILLYKIHQLKKINTADISLYFGFWIKQLSLEITLYYLFKFTKIIINIFIQSLKRILKINVSSQMNL